MMQKFERGNYNFGHHAFRSPHPTLAFTWSPGDFQSNSRLRLYLLDAASRVPAVAPDECEPGIPLLGLSDDQRASVPLLDRSGLDVDGYGQPEGVHHHEPLSALYLLPGVKPAEPPFSVVLTDWLSTAPALGWGSRWARSRQRQCRRSYTRSSRPESRALAKNANTAL